MFTCTTLSREVLPRCNRVDFDTQGPMELGQQINVFGFARRTDPGSVLVYDAPYPDRLFVVVLSPFRQIFG